ncbi:MAG: DEAD/DEAH box helicase [Clostridia bacterium]|nr:DEAD/DEAH box helicase [Clostridia bacterium]
MIETFEALGLSPALVSALKKENITIPTEIQQKVIPDAMKNKDIIAQSETGTGKTLAYLLPLYEKLNAAAKEMQAIVLVPTHELAIQILRQIERLSLNSEIKITGAPIIGNVNIDRQIEKLKEKPHIIVGSAGRILELIKKKKISAHTIKTIIIDEADRLTDESNLENVRAVIKSTLRERQLLMFSASISGETLTRGNEIMKEPEFIKAEERTSIPETIDHIYFLSEQRDKLEVLRKLVRIINPQRAIVFVNNQGNETEISASKLQYHGLKAESIHGTSRKLDRKKVMDDFRAGKLQLLVASDLAARGLDIEGVTHIFNLNLPEDPKDYLHRAGRTGRKGNSGTSISIVSERELELVKKYAKALNITMQEKSMYEGKIIDGRRTSSKRPTKPVKRRPVSSKTETQAGKQ